MEDLIAGVTEEHGIAPDFLEAVQASHTEGLDALAAEHTIAMDSAAAASQAATEALVAAHAAEIERIRAEKFEEVLDPDAGIDSVGDSTIDNLTVETYWEEV